MKPTTKASRKPKIHLASQEVIALHVDLVAAAFKKLAFVNVLPSGSIKIDQTATAADLQTLLRFMHQEGTIGSTFRFFMEGDIWNDVQKLIGKRQGIQFLITVFGEELGRRLYWRYRFRGHIASQIPLYNRDYTMTQREVCALVGRDQKTHSTPLYTDQDFDVRENGQVYFNFDANSQHFSVPVPAESITKLVQSTLK